MTSDVLGSEHANPTRLPTRSSAMSPSALLLAPRLSGVAWAGAPPGSAQTMNVTFLDPQSDTQWDQLVLSHPSSSFFHSSAWARVLTRTYGHKPFYLRLTSNGRTAALLPLMEVNSRLTGRRGVCLPFSDFATPLIFSRGSEGEILRRLGEIARERKWLHAEIRGGLDHMVESTDSLTFHGHALDLRGGEEVVFANLNSSTRRAIRKAQSNGLTIRVDNSESALRDFYNLHILTRRRHGVPPQPWAFFRSIQEEILDRRLGLVVSAHRADRCLAAAVYFSWGTSAVYKFGASDLHSLHLRPNHLVMWEAIKLLMADGASSLHFGRTSPDNPGLRRFKRSWGTVEEKISYVRINGTDKPLAGAGRTAAASTVTRKVFRNLPPVLNRLAGALLYQHLD
jgi:CelD/BcsL family acetyltransferase involved in cellulose biosynthesis